MGTNGILWCREIWLAGMIKGRFSFGPQKLLTEMQGQGWAQTSSLTATPSACEKGSQWPHNIRFWQRCRVKNGGPDIITYSATIRACAFCVILFNQKPSFRRYMFGRVGMGTTAHEYFRKGLFRTSVLNLRRFIRPNSPNNWKYKHSPLVFCWPLPLFCNYLDIHQHTIISEKAYSKPQFGTWGGL